jgi:hypothetical protein
MSAVEIPSAKDGGLLAIEEIAVWRALFPKLRVCDPQSLDGLAPFAIDPPTVGVLQHAIKKEGYFHLDPPRWTLPLAEMANAVASLHRRRLPTGFVLICDEFWLLYAKLHTMLRGLLGEDYKLRPDFWAWCITADGEDSGWRPHRDGSVNTLRPDRSPKSLSIWIPLTDATPLNSCIYVLPAHLDPQYGLGPGTAIPDVSHIRALPAVAGSLLCWPPPLLHWGARSAQRNIPPRISVAYEFQRGDEEPFNTPLLEPMVLPRFERRLWLVCKQVRQYKHMYPLSPDMMELVESVLAQPIPSD